MSSNEAIEAMVENLQAEVRAGADLMRQTMNVIESEPDPWPEGSSGDEAFRAGVEAGMTAMMAQLGARGWLVIPEGDL